MIELPREWKYCRKCSELKPLKKDFHRNRRTPDGRMPVCKSCTHLSGVRP